MGWEGTEETRGKGWLMLGIPTGSGEEETAKRERESRREDAGRFYSYKILRDTNIAPPLAMLLRLDSRRPFRPAANAYECTPAPVFPSWTPIIGGASERDKRRREGEQEAKRYGEFM